ncbi:hypothetical protein T484DRAFT_1778535 [Baffinella frigidus]|nr:hypothetical protein T484DRAFT_1778535 [Cryptophyta sp. CCMP2293]
MPYALCYLLETHSIARYICGKNKLETLYPADVQKRALVDSQLDWQLSALYPTFSADTILWGAQLDWQLSSFYPCVRTHLYEHIGFAGPSSEELDLYAHIGFAGPSSSEDKTAAEAKFAADLWPTLQFFQKGNGAAITVADVFLGIALHFVCKRLPDGFIAKTEGVKEYAAKVKASLPKWAEYMGDSEGFYTPPAK